MFQHNKANVIFFSLLALTINALAAPKKSIEPYYFVSDRLTYLSKAHTITYYGHVKVDQGKTHITGSKLVLDLTANNKVTKMIDTGHRATYTSTQKDGHGIIHAKADKITYNQLQEKVYLDGHAWVEQNHNTINAAHIIYDKKTGTVHTHGAPKQLTTHIVVMPTKVEGKTKKS